jgi:hypothetical protein
LWVSLSQGFADFPVVAGGVEDSAETPAVLVGDGNDLGGAGGNGLGAEGVGVFGDKEHANGAAAEEIGAEVEVFGGFFGDPEVGAVDGELGDASAGDFVEHGGVEGGDVELEGGGVVFDGEGGGDVGGGPSEPSGIDKATHAITVK